MIDLHLHTRASDGTWTPEEALNAAARFGLTAAAFADHDSLASTAAGMAIARRLSLRFIRAVEISAGSNAEGILHILGYGVDPGHPRLRAVLAANQAAWDENERLSLQALARLGIHVSPERYAYWTRHREAGGWPTYNCLVEMGLVADHREYFNRYFGPGRPACVTSTFAAPAEVVAAVKAAGGVPVLAHPGADDPEGRAILGRPGFLDSLIALGIEGFEAYAVENSPAVTEYLLAYSRARGLLITGGSDCHGTFVAGRRLGHPPVPDECLPPLLARLRPGTYV